jgi:hypothetical protein
MRQWGENKFDLALEKQRCICVPVFCESFLSSRVLPLNQEFSRLYDFKKYR